jgi:hypothetical protein
VNGPTATIARLMCEYLVALKHRDASGVAWRLDALARGQLSERCGAALSAVLDPADPSVWVIRRLDVGLVLPLGPGGTDAVAAASWAEAIAGRIAGVVSGQVALPAGEAIRYPDRAAYLASFAADLARGAAAGRWEYEDLAGLMLVPVGRAVATAAQRLDVTVSDVMRRLAVSRRLEAVIAGLAAPDAEELWRACCAEASPGPVDPAAVAGLLARPAASAPALCPAAAMLRLLGAVLVDVAAAAAPGPVIAAVAEAVRLGGRPSVGGGRRTPAAEAATGRRAGRRARATGERQGAAGVGLAAHSEPPLLPSPASSVCTGARPVFAAYPTPYAALLRLVPSLLAAGMDAATLAATQDVPAAAALRHQVLLRCLGRRAGPLATLDPALAVLAGLDHRDPASEGRVDGDRLLQGVLAALAESGRADTATVALARLADPAGRGQVLLLRAVAQDAWLFCGADGGERTRRRALSMIAASGLPIGSLMEDGPASGADLDFLGAARPAAVSVLAQVGIRLFSRRLIGFGQAGAGHLVANALSAPGTVTMLPGRIDVLVEPCPLQVVLDLAGLDKLTFAIPWLDAEVTIRTVGGRA